MNEFETKESADYNEKYILPILPGNITEFFHGDNTIGLRIPISEVNGDIDSAIAKAKKAGFYFTKVIEAKEGETKEGYKYLEISKQGYTENDGDVVVQLRNIAIEISKEDHAKHIKNDLPLILKMNKR